MKKLLIALSIALIGTTASATPYFFKQSTWKHYRSMPFEKAMKKGWNDFKDNVKKNKGKQPTLSG